tara:strand:- start:5490 stop:5648 length:159 start_codon:yes stop_codon:yes gene_type:complete
LSAGVGGSNIKLVQANQEEKAADLIGTKAAPMVYIYIEWSECPQSRRICGQI